MPRRHPVPPAWPGYGGPPTYTPKKERTGGPILVGLVTLLVMGVMTIAGVLVKGQLDKSGGNPSPKQSTAGPALNLTGTAEVTTPTALPTPTAPPTTGAASTNTPTTRQHTTTPPRSTTPTQTDNNGGNFGNGLPSTGPATGPSCKPDETTGVCQPIVASGAAAP